MSNLKQKIEHQLIEKAMKDANFRKQLLEHPKPAFEQETGIHLPPNLTIRVLQEDKYNLYLILPSMQSEVVENELTETELESVSGGTVWTGGDCPRNLPPE